MVLILEDLLNGKFNNNSYQVTNKKRDKDKQMEAYCGKEILK